MSAVLNIPPIECWVRNEYLYNLEHGFGEFSQATAFGVKSLQGTALLFLVMTELGAIYDKIPISALCTNKQAPPQPYDHLQLWDCFSYQAHVVQFMFLKGKRAQVLLKDGNKYEGLYRFTLDWTGDSSDCIATTFAEEPSQHKSAHVIELFNGNFCAYPNNRILWAEPSLVSEPFARIPDYKLNMQSYHCESKDKWGTEDTDKLMYGINQDS